MELVGIWTEAKSQNPDKNEDVTFFSRDVLVLADGATDKTGILYPSGKSGGRELAEIATDVASSSSATGYDLAEEITAAVRTFYESANPGALSDASKRAATTLVAARLMADKLVLTQIGDSNVRISFHDGSQQVFTNDKLIDTENAKLRSDYIRTELQKKTKEFERELNKDEVQEIIKQGREQIQDRLNTQYTLQNNADDKTYGYGTIDGMTIPKAFADGTPTEFVKTYVFEQKDIASIELVSDGFYGDFPETISVAEYETLYTRLHTEDPDKYLKYLSTKPKDDAAVIIARLV